MDLGRFAREAANGAGMGGGEAAPRARATPPMARLADEAKKEAESVDKNVRQLGNRPSTAATTSGSTRG